MGIRIGLHLREDLDSSEVRADGFESFPLTDETAKIFGIPRQVVSGHYDEGRHGQLWSVINNWWGRFPNEFVTSDPVVGSGARNVPDQWTPYADAWGEENQVIVERKAVGATIIETTGSVDAITTGNVRNNDRQEQPGQEIELNYTEEVEDSRSSEKNWHVGVTLGYEVTVGGEYAGFSAEAKRSVEFSFDTGGSKTTSHTVTKGRSVRLKANVDAAPRTIYPVSVMAGQGSLRVKVDYEYRLRGQWRALYTKKAYNGSLAAPLSDIGALLEALHKPTMIADSETLDVGFVTDGQIDIGEGKPLD